MCVTRMHLCMLYIYIYTAKYTADFREDETILKNEGGKRKVSFPRKSDVHIYS